MTDIPLPIDLDAEASCLSASMADESGVTFDELREVLVVNDFYSDANKHIYEALCELRDASQPIDLVTVARRLRDRNQFKQAYFETITVGTPAAVNVKAHAASVKDKSKLRQFIHQAATLRAQAYTDLGADGVQEFLERAETEIGIIAHSDAQKKLEPVQSVMQAVTDAAQHAKDHQRSIIGIPTGFDLDTHTSGLHDGDFRIVAARPGIGKSAFVLDESMHVAKRGYAVAFFSLEMPTMQLGFRAVSSAAGITTTAIRSGKLTPTQWSNFTEHVDRIRKLPIWIDDTPNLSMPQLRARVRRLQQEIAAGKHPSVTKKRIGAVYVDYLQLMQSPDAGNKYSNRETLVSAISRGFKMLAKELALPITAVAQLNREVEKRGNRRPQLSDLRESGSLEMDADTVIFIYRDDYYNKDSDAKGVAEMHIAKQRNGATTMVPLTFTAEYTRFGNLASGQEYVDEFDDGFEDGDVYSGG